MSAHGANPIFFNNNNNKKGWTSRTLANLHPLRLITFHFCLTLPPPPKSARRMCITVSPLMECRELNWLCKHMDKVRSSQVALLILNWVKQFFPVSIIKLYMKLNISKDLTLFKMNWYLSWSRWRLYRSAQLL